MNGVVDISIPSDYVKKEDGKGLSTNDFTNEDKTKLDNIQNPMQIVGRVDSVEDLPSSGVRVGDAYLVGTSGSETFDEYVCTEISEETDAPTWESIGSTQKQSDWEQTTSTAADYIKNKPGIVIGDANASRSSVMIVGNTISNGSTQSFAAGTQNTFDTGSSQSIACGSSNTLQYSASQNIVGGSGNSLNSTSKNIVGGESNIVNTGSTNIVAGSSNTVQSSSVKNIVGGNGNSLSNTCSSNVVGGSSIVADHTTSNCVLTGTSNTVDSLANAVVGGSTNTAKYGGNVLVNGISNTSNNSDGSIVAGETNFVVGSRDTILSGNHNFVNTGFYTLVTGNGNVAYFSEGSAVFGVSPLTLTVTRTGSKTFTVSGDYTKFKNAYLMNTELPACEKITNATYSSNKTTFTTTNDISLPSGTTSFTAYFGNQVTSKGSLVAGSRNLDLSTSNSSCNTLLGNSNILNAQSSNNNIIVGVNNMLDAGSSHDNILGGTSNKMTIYGSTNTFVVGSGNTVSGSFNSVIAGASNTVNASNVAVLACQNRTASESNTLYTQNIDASGIITLGSLQLKDDSGVLKVSDDNGTTWKTVTLS